MSDMNSRTNSGRAPGRPRQQVDMDRVRELLESGAKLRAIARQLGLGYGTVHRAVNGMRSAQR